MIRIDNLTFSYNDKESRPVLEGINLQINSGEFFGIIGPNGSGKTTLFKLILGFLKPDSGTIKIDGDDLKNIRRKQIARKISAVMQDFLPAYDFTVQEIVHMGRTPYLGLLSGEEEKDYRVVREVIEETELGGFEEKTFSRLSGGEKQRVLIAKCFAQKTPILLLDEFVSHLDPGHIQQLVQRVYQKNKREKVTVLGIFHDINTASLYCDRLAVLNEGKIVKTGPPDLVIDEEILTRVYNAKGFVIKHPKTGKPQVLLQK